MIRAHERRRSLPMQGGGISGGCGCRWHRGTERAGGCPLWRLYWKEGLILIVFLKYTRQICVSVWGNFSSNETN